MEWFADSKEPDKNDSSPQAIPRSHLVRPLPWVLFLPLLVCLRLVKLTADLVTSLIGKEPLRPSQVVRFLRVRRRRLRAVKYQGFRKFQIWQKTELDNRQAEGKYVVLRLLSVGPLAKVATFIGLIPLLSSVNCASPTKSGKRKTLATDSESSDEYENLLEKIKRMCHNYTSDEDPDYEPSEDEESHDSESSSEEEPEANDCQLRTVTEANLDNTLLTPEINMFFPTSEPENQRAVSIPPDTTNHQTTMATSDTADKQAKPDTPSSKFHTAITTNPEAVSTDDNNQKYPNEEQDGSSSTLSLDSTEACSESTSQTFYSPLNSSSVTPEPKASAATQETQLTESALTIIPAEVESESADQSDSLVPLQTSTKSHSSSITSGSTSSLKDFNEDTKGKSKFSSFFQIRKKSLPQNS